MIKNNFTKKRLLLIISFLMALALVNNNLNFAEENTEYDIVIKGGRIINPETEHELKGYNLAIKDGAIVKISKENLYGEKEIDATGLVVSPGFIDLISYEPNTEGVKFKILDGVTSNLLMHGGTANASKWYKYWGNVGRKVNYGASSFITKLRWPIIGYNIDKSITKEEDIQTLVDSVRKNIEEGALGISFSFEYIPGIKSNEVIPLLELANEYNVPTFYHLRYSDAEEPGTGIEGIQEVIDYAKETGAIIHIMHINSTGGTFCMDEALDMVEKAREEGLDVTTCVYPYDYWATYINSARFRPGWQERYHITYNDLQVGGTEERVTEETFKEYRSKHMLVAALGSMPEEELIMTLKKPYVMIGSDTIIEPSHNNHPRGAGTYGRLFGKYVREEQVLTLMDAIKKASYLPAKRLESAAPSMKRKGRIEIGADADITIFNPDTIIDKSTVKNPAIASEGIEYVIVNGVIVKDDKGIVENVNPGQPIQSYFVDKSVENTPIKYEIVLDNTNVDNIEKVYSINEEKYVPIKTIIDTIDIPIDEKINGEIEINNIVKLELGSSIAIRNGEEINLLDEPIIYKGQIYVNEKDLESILQQSYSVQLLENKIVFNTLDIPENEDAEKDKDTETDENKEDETENEDLEEETNTMMDNIFIFLFVLIVVSIILFIFRTKIKEILRK